MENTEQRPGMTTEIPPGGPKKDTPQVSDMVNRILEHPELISMIAATLGTDKPGVQTAATPQPADRPTSAAGQDAAPTAEATPPPAGEESGAVAAQAKNVAAGLPDAMATLAPLLSGLTGGKPPDDPRSCLLRALKPYVSHKRAEAIDTMIQLSRVSELLKKKN